MVSSPWRRHTAGAVAAATIVSVVVNTEFCGGHRWACSRHHKILWWAPQNSVVITTEFCGGHHRILWWFLAKQNSVNESENRYFLTASNIYLTVDAYVDTYMYEHTLHKGSIAESPNKGNNRVLLPPPPLAGSIVAAACGHHHHHHHPAPLTKKSRE